MVLALAVALVLAGLAGTVVPLLPGVPLVWVGLWIAAWSDGFDRVGIGTLVVLALLTALSLALDLATSAFTTRRLGGTRAAAIGAALGTLAGLPFGLLGLFLGPFAGAALGEYLSVKDAARAGRAGAGSWVGLALAIAARFAVAFSMLGLFMLAWIF